ncbi:MAG: cyclic nucleotide-binding protein [Meiothermus sp.]|nr:MAG: cyclic nucleotide-binding protein [Meiothermus sp.]
MSEADWAGLEGALRLLHFEPGAVILSPAQPEAEGLYVVFRGEVRLEQDGQAVAWLEPGEAFGYPSLLGQQPPSLTVRAEGEAACLLLAKEAFHRLLERPSFALFFSARLAERLRLFQPSALSLPDLGQPAGEAAEAAVWLEEGASVAQAARRMRERGVSALLLQTPEGLAILTDRDLRNRVLAEELSPSTPALRVASAPAKTLPAASPLYEALAYLEQQGIHHLPLTEGSQVVGLLTDRLFLRRWFQTPLGLLRSLEQGDLGSLQDYRERLHAIVRQMLAAGFAVPAITRQVSLLNDALTRSLLRRSEARLGPPPCPYAWLALGSEGRTEQALLTDQDNALVFQNSSARPYFVALAQDVLEGLLEAGFPPCPGGFMADRWCYALSEWAARFQQWLEKPEGERLLEAQVFLDFRSIAGGLSPEPLHGYLRQASKNRAFLTALAHSALAFTPPLGFLGRIHWEAGQINLKKGGLAAIVALARVYGLEAGSLARPTPERLRAAAEARLLPKEEAEDLSEAFLFLSHLRLKHQLAALGRGQLPSNRVAQEALSPREQQMLRQVFWRIRQAQQALAARFRLQTL